MSAIRSTTGTVEQSTDASFDAGGTAVTGSFDAGSDSDRYLVIDITWDGSSAHTIGDTAVTYNGVPLTPMGATTAQSTNRLRSYELVAPATGSNTWSVDPSTGVGASPAIVAVHCYSGADQSDPSDAIVTASGVDVSNPFESAVTVSSAADDMVHVAHSAKDDAIASGVATGFTERTDNVVDSGTQDVGLVTGNQPGAASVVTSVAWSGGDAINWLAHGWNINAATAGGTPAAALTGTLANGATEAQIVAGGETLIITLTDDTWVATGATFNAQRQAIIDGLDSGGSEPAAWNAEVRDALAVTDVARTSDTVVTITLPALASYSVSSAGETITCTVPAAALTAAGAVVATPTFAISNTASATTLTWEHGEFGPADTTFVATFNDISFQSSGGAGGFRVILFAARRRQRQK